MSDAPNPVCAETGHVWVRVADRARGRRNEAPEMVCARCGDPKPVSP